MCAHLKWETGERYLEKKNEGGKEGILVKGSWGRGAHTKKAGLPDTISKGEKGGRAGLYRKEHNCQRMLRV